MLDLISSNPMIQFMDKSMTLATRRASLVASNLANIDTPGYKTRDFSFEKALKAEMSASQNPATMTRTHVNHMASNSTQSGGLRPAGIKPTYERNDGNDVNLDKQNMLLARTQGQYSIASSIAQVEIRRVYQAIREGAK